ncbi:MAG: hypothetical protein ABIG93_03480 [archaeon]|nr:hypothetical protein [Nanoarchaeota archaeon]
MNKKSFVLILIVLISTVLLISACEELVTEDSQETAVGEEPVVTEETPIEEPELVVEQPKVKVQCTNNDGCEWDEVCIDRFCGKMTDIYDTEGDCEEKCNFNEVHVTTSDGDEVILSRGQGSYTMAGAIAWKLISSADYCIKEDPTPVAIELSYKSTGVIIGKEIVILDVGEESEVISHPTIPGSDFTLTVESINEECS